MKLTIENILLIGSILLFISIILSKASFRFGFPTLLIFLIIGFLSGSEGIGGIHFNDPELAQFIGTVALNIILFNGGLNTQIDSIKPVLKEGISLSSIGVFLTAIFLGIIIWYFTDFDLYESFLIGAIVSSTDTAAVFSILRTRNLFLKNKLRPILEFESGSNDPMAYVLTIALLSLIKDPDQNIFRIIFLFFKQMILGGILGILLGILIKWIINKIELEFEGLYLVLIMNLMFFAFSLIDSLGGNGFLGVYISAIYLGNNEIIHKKTYLKVFDGLAWLMQIILFLTLGLLAYPSQIIKIAKEGLLISFSLILIARPLSVFISLLPFQLDIRSLLYISWVGLRGAVPIVFAIYPLIEGLQKAVIIFDIVFFVSLTSIIIQGTTISIAARFLKVVDQENFVTSDIDKFLADIPRTALKEFRISEQDFSANKRIVDLGFPKNAIIALIRRDKNYIIPSGNTKLEPNDILIVLCEDEKGFKEVENCIYRNS